MRSKKTGRFQVLESLYDKPYIENVPTIIYFVYIMYRIYYIPIQSYIIIICCLKFSIVQCTYALWHILPV